MKKKKHVHRICLDEWARLRKKRLMPCCFCIGHNCDKDARYVGPIPKEENN